jgi:uncharacterized protein YrzB (UPF0473 family)
MSIKKTNWVSNFNLVGRAKINDNTFKIGEVSESGWEYSNLNLGVDCGEKCGVVYANMMGGFSRERKNVIYVHGKKEDGSDDWQNNFQINWEDRFNEELLQTIGDSCFIVVGLERTDSDKLFRNKFLSQYDAIKYVKEHLEDDDVITVRGNLKYSFYNDNVTMQRDIQSIFLSKAEPKDFRATFRQSILLDKESINPKEDVDAELNRAKVHARVLDYVKEINGVEIKGNYPFNFNFDFDFETKEKFTSFYKAIFKVTKGITQVNFEGEFVNSGAVVQATAEDISDDLKALIDIGMYTEEEVLAKYASNNYERRYVLVKPILRKEGDGESATVVAQIFKERYTEEELDVNAITVNTVDTDSLAEVMNSDDDEEWMKEMFG